jgi:uridine kinase
MLYEKLMYLCLDFELYKKHVKLLKENKMKKVFLFFVVALAFASCAPKAAETTEEAVVDPVEVVAVDTVAVDTVAAL